jgi:ElaB/YqjD/DUF883 family membrane-anchored ribosome-binding protein
MQDTPQSTSSALDPRDVAQRAHASIDRVRTSAHETVERAASLASSAADRVSARSGDLLATKDEWMETTRGYVREHPFAALGIALAAGYLLSRITGR